MAAVRMAGTASLQRIETSIGKGGASACSSSAECCAFACSSGTRKVCTPRGLSGDGLSGGVTRRRSAGLSFAPPLPRLTRKVAVLASPPRRNTAASSSSAPVRSFQGESLMKDIDTQDLEAETPSLLEQCSDLDWKLLVDDLRSEALHSLQVAGLRALSLSALENLMGSWIHDQMVNGIESPREGKVPEEELKWSFEDAADDLRTQAKLQAAQVLAKGVDSTFDWESDVAELHQRILLQGAAEQSQRLLQAWSHVQGGMADSADQLEREALGSTAAHAYSESPVAKPEAEADESSDKPSSNGSIHGKKLFFLGAAVATGLAVEGSWILDGVAEELNPEALEAASRAPSWLVPAVVLFPPISYFIFNLYRDKVDPNARLTDWMFGIAVITIVSNIVMMAVWGVRLY